MRRIVFLALLGAFSCAADRGAHEAPPWGPPHATSGAPLTVTLVEAKGAASVAVPAQASTAPKRSDPAGLIPSATYVLDYSLQSEFSCSQSVEGHSALGELTLELHGSAVTIRLDDSFGHMSGSSQGRYTTPGGGLQHERHDRHLVFSGTQSLEGDHVRIDVDGGISLSCVRGDVELSPPIDPNASASPAPHGQKLKGFSCEGGSKMFDTDYDRLHSVAARLSFAVGKKLHLDGTDMGMGSPWTRLDIAIATP